MASHYLRRRILFYAIIMCTARLPHIAIVSKIKSRTPLVVGLDWVGNEFFKPREPQVPQQPHPLRILGLLNHRRRQRELDVLYP
jgi:hypothetical protein